MTLNTGTQHDIETKGIKKKSSPEVLSEDPFKNVILQPQAKEINGFYFIKGWVLELFIYNNISVSLKQAIESIRTNRDLSRIIEDYRPNRPAYRASLD